MSILQFSEHLQLIFDNSNVNKRQTNKTKNGKLFFCKLPHPSERSQFGIQICSYITYTRRSCYIQVRSFPTLTSFPFFSWTFLDLIFATIRKTMLLIQSAVLFTSCHQKYCAYYGSEHLKYCSQIEEYWLNKNGCLNMVLGHHSMYKALGNFWIMFSNKKIHFDLDELALNIL